MSVRDEQEVRVRVRVRVRGYGRSCGVVSTRFEKGPERLGRRVCDCATEESNEGEMNVRNEIISEDTCLLCRVTGQPNTNMILSIAMIVPLNDF